MKIEYLPIVNTDAYRILITISGLEIFKIGREELLRQIIADIEKELFELKDDHKG